MKSWMRAAGRGALALSFAFVLAASLIIPANVVAPQPAQAGVMKWDIIQTPGYVTTRNDIMRQSEIDRFVVSPAGTMLAIVTKLDTPAMSYLTSSDGISWGGSTELSRAMLTTWGVIVNCWDVAAAPDDPNCYAIVTSSSTVDAPVEVWVTNNSGAKFEVANLSPLLGPAESIRSISISQLYADKRDIAVATTTGAGGGRILAISSKNFGSWQTQLNPLPGIDYFDIEFSPTYNGDSSLAMVYANATATYFNIGFRDINNNSTLSFAYSSPGIEVKNPASAASSSPGLANLRGADMDLPADFSGQSASLRRAYVSLDAVKDAVNQTGIYRIDDTTTYVLMDTTPILNKDIYSIAYFGTYASGKLLAGERYGYPCSATVPTWFTDSPTTCPIPCWYPALKPTTGAAGQLEGCSALQTGNGGAIVNWGGAGQMDGSLALVTTGSLLMTTGMTWFAAWPTTPVLNDETAFAISRNNGETWNQIGLIDTTIDWFNDVAVPSDGTTIYLASANRNSGNPCGTFDSVWRATINPNVAAPLAAIPPIGYYWERVFCHVTSGSCDVPQSDLPILRVITSCIDKKDGEIVGWAAQLAHSTVDTSSGGVMAWSPDYGDYWAVITPRDVVQDFVLESSSTMYTVSPTGLVQRLPYTGTAWATNLPSYDTMLNYAHTISAMPYDKILIGAGYGADYPIAFSFDKGVTFTQLRETIRGHGNEHVIFDVDFKDNSFIYLGCDMWGGLATAPGTVYRNTIPNVVKWTDADMMSIANGAVGITWPVPANGPPHTVGIFGLAMAWTGNPQPALYAAHSWITNSQGKVDSAVCRTLTPRTGMPKPGIEWSCLDIFAPFSNEYVQFTLEPTSLKYSGCCNLNTNTSLYAIDDQTGNFWGWDTLATSYSGMLLTGKWNNHLSNPAIPWDMTYPGYTPSLNQGMLWTYTDCLAKKGPILKSPADKFLIGADPVSGRNQQVDLRWEQLCLSTGYELQIAKDKNFTLRINPIMNNADNISAVTGSIILNMDQINMTSPAAWIAPGALPEAGAIYYWRIRTYKSATTQLAWSPWSESRSFTVKAGFIVNTPYYGVQLLSPNNGCFGCKVKPAAFSWSPWKEATKYQFDLAKDSEFKQMVVTATTTTTGYAYNGTLDYSTNYFWRVKALEVKGQNIPSDWSATFSFQTEPSPAPEKPAPATPATPLWVWVVIATISLMVIVTIIFIFTTRR
jgi:hypothetical protein